MGNNFMGSMVVILTAIIGVATLAVLVSKNAQTPEVINASFGGLSQFLGVAVSPVTGGSGGTGSGLSLRNMGGGLLSQF